MDHEQRRAWVKMVWGQSGRSQAALARLLKIDNSRVTRMLKEVLGEKPREISIEEILAISADLGIDPPEALGLVRRQIVGGVRVVGRINENSWSDGLVAPSAAERVVAGVLNERYPIAKQFAFEGDADGLLGEDLRRGDILLAVAFEEYRKDPLPRDLLIVRRHRGPLQSLTLRRAVAEGERVVLRPVLAGIIGDAADIRDEIIGLALGFQRAVL